MRALKVTLVEDTVVRERGLCLAPGRCDRLLQLGRLTYDAHSAPAAAGSRLDDQREADLLGLAGGDDWHTGLAGEPFRLQLVAAGAQGVGRRPDPNQLRRVHGLREVRALGQEAVARMNRVRAYLLRGANVLLREQIAGDCHRLVGRARVQRALVVGSDHCDGCDPELAAGAEDAQRDLAAIRDEQLSNHAFLPGLRRFRGSNTCFTAPCRSNARGPS